MTDDLTHRLHAIAMTATSQDAADTITRAAETLEWYAAALVTLRARLHTAGLSTNVDEAGH